MSYYTDIEPAIKGASIYKGPTICHVSSTTLRIILIDCDSDSYTAFLWGAVAWFLVLLAARPLLNAHDRAFIAQYIRSS